jgi:hypothetical protein
MRPEWKSLGADDKFRRIAVPAQQNHKRDGALQAQDGLEPKRACDIHCVTDALG